jgi:hypothetical protein
MSGQRIAPPRPDTSSRIRFQDLTAVGRNRPLTPTTQHRHLLKIPHGTKQPLPTSLLITTTNRSSEIRSGN